MFVIAVCASLWIIAVVVFKTCLSNILIILIFYYKSSYFSSLKFYFGLILCFISRSSFLFHLEHTDDAFLVWSCLFARATKLLFLWMLPWNYFLGYILFECEVRVLYFNSLKVILFYVSGCFSAHVFVSHCACLESSVARRGHRIPRNWSHR